MRAEEITDILTPEGIKNLKKGQILMFQKDGKRIDLKITKLTKKRVWAKEVKTYSVDETLVMLKERGKVNNEQEK